MFCIHFSCTLFKDNVFSTLWWVAFGPLGGGGAIYILFFESTVKVISLDIDLVLVNIVFLRTIILFLQVVYIIVRSIDSDN